MQKQNSGSYPVYLPKESLLTEKIIWAAHKKTIHGETRSQCQI